MKGNRTYSGIINGPRDFTLEGIKSIWTETIALE
jgi:hypothetical protein